ncbi:MAG: type II secretion system F family protein [Myxococcota bacterium]
MIFLLALRLAATALSTAALVAGGWWLAAGEDAPARRAWRAYARWVDASLQPLFVRLSPRDYALRHAGVALGAATACHLLLGSVFASALALAAAAWAGFRWPARARARRLARLDTQIDPALRNIAQTTRATANIVDALETVARQMEPPMAQEIELCVRQHRLGLTIESALQELGARAGSRNLDAAITAIVIGRTTGGNLPDILDEIAGVLRERMRLEAFIDARTAEGKAQAWIMGSMPIVLGVVVYVIDPEFVRPMFTDPLGWAILGVIFLLVVGGVALVRKVSAVEA